MNQVNHSVPSRTSGAADDTRSDIRRSHLLLRLLPRAFVPYALIARWDRPIGVWLMLLPGLWGLCLAAPLLPPISLWLLFLIGAFAMRGAGCTINDILDRKLDAQVARTATRPLASGEITLHGAVLWLALQLLLGLVVLLQLPAPAQWFGIAALPLIFLYPLMKRITWWPQAWLGLTFNWGIWIGAAATNQTGIIPLQAAYFWLYLGGICWTLGYDTIYAVQDRADDAKIGVRSTARLWGDAAPRFVYAMYAAALLCWALVGVSLPLIYYAGWLAAAAVALWLLRGWQPGQESENALSARRAFVRNQYVGLALLLGILITKL